MQGSKYAGRLEEINLRAAALAREAAGSNGVLVAGSMGPLGKLLKPFGPVSFEEARSAYGEQARALTSGGVDFLVMETQFSLDEGRAALEGSRAETDVPVVVSFSYDRGTRTMMGVPPSMTPTFDDLFTGEAPSGEWVVPAIDCPVEITVTSVVSNTPIAGESLQIKLIVNGSAAIPAIPVNGSATFTIQAGDQINIEAQTDLLG